MWAGSGFLASRSVSIATSLPMDAGKFSSLFDSALKLRSFIKSPIQFGMTRMVLPSINNCREAGLSEKETKERSRTAYSNQIDQNAQRVWQRRKLVAVQVEHGHIDAETDLARDKLERVLSEQQQLDRLAQGVSVQRQPRGCCARDVPEDRAS